MLCHCANVATLKGISKLPDTKLQENTTNYELHIKSLRCNLSIKHEICLQQHNILWTDAGKSLSLNKISLCKIFSTPLFQFLLMPPAAIKQIRD